MGEVRFDVLGPLRCTHDGDHVELGGAKQQMVLALLLLDANRVVSTNRLSEWVWPQSGEDVDGASRPGAGTLQVYISNLRRIFAAKITGDQTLITTTKPGYRMDVSSTQLDMLEFESLTSGAESSVRSGDLDSAWTMYRSALALWRGEPLAGLPVDVSDSGPITRLGVQRLAVQEAIADVALRSGRHGEILPELITWVSLHPLNETLRGHLMVALYRGGRQADALASYAEGRRALIDQLGIDPSRALRDLEARILAQDPNLEHLGGGSAPMTSDGFDEAGPTDLRSSLLDQRAWIDIDGRRFPLERSSTTIGRMTDRDIVVTDDRVSRRHVEIHRSGNSYSVVDVGSSNGMTVNGNAVTQAHLCDGDRIAIGDTELVFHCDDID